MSSASATLGPQSEQQKSHGGVLSIMMFLQYAVWGVWLPYLANYLGAPIEKGGLGFTGGEVGWILGLAASIGAVTSPFLAGQIADRFINAERYLAILLIIGGALNYSLYYARDYTTFLMLSIAYSVVYMPTLALTNSIAFANLRNPETQFPLVRMWGTFGWIVASNAFPLLWLQTEQHFSILPPFVAGTPRPNSEGLIADCLRVSGVLAMAYGLFSLIALPKTPPRRSASEPLAFAKAFALFSDPGLLVLTIAALPIAMIHQVYFIRTGPFLQSIGFDVAHVGPVMSIGQFSELLFLALLGLFIARLGYRWTLVLGGVAYVLRFAVFAISDSEMRNIVALACTLHGLCYGCFFAGAYIYVERMSPPDVRHSAQTVFGIIILGLGPVLAGYYNQAILDGFKTSDGTIDFSKVWWTQSAIGLAATLLIALAFRSGIRPRGMARPEVAA